MACCVEFEPVPASTRQRLFALATATRITCSRSSWESVGDSPVVPIATIPVIPAAICASISCSNAETSMPPSRNGVTNAVNVPRNMFSKPLIYTDETLLRKEAGSQSVNIRVHPWLCSNLDCSLENKFCRTGECDVAETSFDFLKADVQFVSAVGEDADWPFAIFNGGEDERAGDYSRPAGKRLVFHAPFIGADGD